MVLTKCLRVDDELSTGSTFSVGNNSGKAGGRGCDEPMCDRTNSERRNKCVWFSETVSKTIVQRHCDEHEGQPTNLWYSGSEINEMYSRNVEVADKILNGEILPQKESDEYTSRGLESIIDPDRFNHRLKRAQKASKAVMKEQNRQRSMGVVFPEEIAECYVKSGAKKSRKEAYSQGVKDQAVAAKQ